MLCTWLMVPNGVIVIRVRSAVWLFTMESQDQIRWLNLPLSSSPRIKLDQQGFKFSKDARYDGRSESSGYELPLKSNLQLAQRIKRRITTSISNTGHKKLSEPDCCNTCVPMRLLVFIAERMSSMRVWYSPLPKRTSHKSQRSSFLMSPDATKDAKSWQFREITEREALNCTDCVGMRVQVCVDRGRVRNHRIRLGFKSDSAANLELATGWASMKRRNLDSNLGSGH